jgi:hypothetical protein
MIQQNLKAKPVAPSEDPISNNCPANANKLSPRLQRLVSALEDRPHTIRELIDIVPTNNPAEYISHLREDFGLAIHCERVSFITVDGNTSWYGVYHLTDDDRAMIESGRISV